MKPYCFVLMPFGEKRDHSGRTINFELVYNEIIRPAVKDADLEPIRADEETVGGIIHKLMFERLVLSDYAVADLTTANANVLYELGVRHGVRPHNTVLIVRQGTRLPFNVGPLRVVYYNMDDVGQPSALDMDRLALTKRLLGGREQQDDSPIYQLLPNMPRPDIARLKTDTFRDRLEYSREIKRRLAIARKADISAVRQIESGLTIADADPAIAIDLMLSYRAVHGWAELVSLVEQMPPELRESALVQEQLGFALNRLGFRDKAEQVLVEVIERYGASSETNGLLGRVYKDRWEEAKESGDLASSQLYLRKAINMYVTGFETDWRDAYPGINALTLMEFVEPRDSRQSELLPVVQYAVKRRLTSDSADYWDYATLLELSVLGNNPAKAQEVLPRALDHVRESWEPETTSRNLKLIRDARHARGEEVGWINELVSSLSAG